MLSTAKFGYFPRCLDFDAGQLRVATLSGLAELKVEIEKSQQVPNGWLVAGHLKRVFGLPKTHQITRDNPVADQHVDFLVWVLGFLVGMRLTTTEAGFLDATPCQPGKLVDFNCSGGDLQRALCCVDDFYVAHHADQSPGLVVAAIHAFFFAQGPHLLCYERLHYLYTALDACWKASLMLKPCLKPRTPHSQRIEKMCGEWLITPPRWAVYDTTTKSSQLSKLRNEMIHEGLVGCEPLGFRIIQSFDGNPHPCGNPLLEVENLFCRLLVAILGIRASAYIASKIDTRNIHGFEIAV
jgi:hypothetical protein